MCSFSLVTLDTVVTLLPLADSFSQDTDPLSGEEGVQLKLQQEVEGHSLGPASLALSPHHSWLASVGRDGLLRVRETSSLVRAMGKISKCVSSYVGIFLLKGTVKSVKTPKTAAAVHVTCVMLHSMYKLQTIMSNATIATLQERCIEIQCHSCHLGGVRSVSFSADSQALLTTGLRDGSLVFTDLR